MLITPKIHSDNRGAFWETWNHQAFDDAGLPCTWVQDNFSVSKKNVVRGIHYQILNAQGKLVRATHGAVLDVAVDLRRSSPCFGEHVAVELSGENGRMLWIPEGFGHAFLVLTEVAGFAYKVTDSFIPRVSAPLCGTIPTSRLHGQSCPKKRSSPTRTRTEQPLRWPGIRVSVWPRILVTGADGQVGRALLASLAGSAQVIPYNRGSLDLSNPDQIRATVARSPDIIINAGAYTAVDRAETERELAFAINGHAPGVLAEEAHRASSLLIHYSTDYVFNGSKKGPWVEEDSTDPLSVYGASKLAGEEAIRKAGGRYLIFRTSWIYAPEGKNFLLTMLRLGRERDSLNVVDDQIGAPTSAAELARATHAIATGIVTGKIADADTWAGTYHMTCAGSVHGVALCAQSSIVHQVCSMGKSLWSIPLWLANIQPRQNGRRTPSSPTKNCSAPSTCIWPRGNRRSMKF